MMMVVGDDDDGDDDCGGDDDDDDDDELLLLMIIDKEWDDGDEEDAWYRYRQYRKRIHSTHSNTVGVRGCARGKMMQKPAENPHLVHSWD